MSTTTFTRGQRVQVEDAFIARFVKALNDTDAVIEMGGATTVVPLQNLVLVE